MKISFLALSVLFSHSNIHNTYAQDDVNQIDNESGNMDEVFQEREEFWTRELGDSMASIPPTRKPSLRPTTKPTLRIPPTNSPTLRVPPTARPSLRVPPTAMPQFRVPPTESPIVRVPPTSAPAFRVPPTQAPVVRVPPTNAPAFRVPPTQAPGVRVPPTQNPAFRIPPTESPVISPPTQNPAFRIPPTESPILVNIPDGTNSSPIIIITPNMGAGYSASEQDLGCGFTSAEMKAQSFIETVSTISAPSALADINSPQSKAAAWIATSQGICPSDANVLQRYVLAVLYFATNGESWIDQLGFLSSANECEWTGIDCDSSGKVTSIAISGNNLAGAVPNEIGALDSLSSISLTQGGLTGPIPDSLYGLPLTELELSENNLSGALSSAIYEMTDLEILHLDNNQFRGSIESEIVNLVNLSSLKLNDNQFKSRMRREFKDMVNLEVAQFHNNNLYGKVPTRMCNLFLPRFDGKLKVLTSDCATLDPVLGTPKVSCECCTQCY